MQKAYEKLSNKIKLYTTVKLDEYLEKTIKKD